MTTSPVLIAGRYRLDVALASGGMGVVWRGWDERLERAVAIKQLRLQPGLSAADTAAARDRALREARLTARLHHPNAVPIYDVVEHDGEPCLIMQFLPSVSLQATLARRSTLPLVDVTRIGSEIASALTAAHRVGIIHRDVKPGNVLLAEDGAAKLTDFGISHAMGDTTLTSTGMVTGTPAYLAPEVARGESATFASDVFSLGATLYTASEGTPPFEPTDNPMALLHRVASGQVRPPTRSGALTPLLMRMLAPDPRARPTMTQAWVDLTSLHASLGIDIAEPTTTQLAAAPVARPAPARRADAVPTAAATAVAPESAGAAGLAGAAASLAAPRVGGDRPSSNPPAQGTAGATGLDVREGDGDDRRRPAAGIVAALVALAVIVAASVYFVTTLGGGSSRSGGATTSATSPAKVSGGRSQARSGGTTSQRPASTSATRSSAGSSSTTQSATRSNTPSATSSNTASAKPSTSAAAPSQTRSTTSSPSRSTSPPTSPTKTKTTTKSTASTSTSSKRPVAASASSGQLARALTDYYALMPGNLNTGYSRLTATYQRTHAGGFSGYQRFWSQFADVSTRNLVTQAPNGATATIIYRYKSGRTISERTHFRFKRSGGQLLIADSNLVSGGPG